MASQYDQYMDFLSQWGWSQDPQGQWVNSQGGTFYDLFGSGGPMSKKNRREFKTQQVMAMLPSILSGDMSYDELINLGYGPEVMGALAQLVAGTQTGNQAMQDRDDAIGQLEGFLNSAEQQQLMQKYSQLLEKPQFTSDQEFDMMRARGQDATARSAQDTMRMATQQMANRGLGTSGLGTLARRQVMDEANRANLQNQRDIALQRAGERQGAFTLASQGMQNIQNQRGDLNSLIAQIYNTTQRAAPDLSGLFGAISGRRGGSLAGIGGGGQ
jgi:hypothetical protein